MTDKAKTVAALVAHNQALGLRIAAGMVRRIAASGALFTRADLHDIAKAIDDVSAEYSNPEFMAEMVNALSADEARLLSEAGVVL